MWTEASVNPLTRSLYKYAAVVRDQSRFLYFLRDPDVPLRSLTPGAAAEVSCCHDSGLNIMHQDFLLL